jgi:hypothetical protein
LKKNLKHTLSHPRKVYLNSLKSFLAEHPNVKRKSIELNARDANDKHVTTILLRIYQLIKRQSGH